LQNVRLDDISFDGGDVDAAMQRRREAIERANTWDVTGACDFEAGPGGYALHVHGYAGPVCAIASGSITARVGATTLGQGDAVLWYRQAGTATLVAGPTVRVYNRFDALIPTGHEIVVAPEGDAYQVIAADCLP
jgi:hypothetical protein